MKNNLNSIQGSNVYDYLLVLQPHEELRNKIMLVKEYFRKEYKVSSLATYPQLPLVKFSELEVFQPRIVNRLQMIAMAFHPIKVELRNYGSLPTHTIFINVISKLPVQELAKQVRVETQRLMKPDPQNKPLFFMEPQIAVAQKLAPWQYEQAWREHREKEFTGRFVADNMVLLRRLQGEKRYVVAANFDFQNLNMSAKQGQLFG